MTLSIGLLVGKGGTPPLESIQYLSPDQVVVVSQEPTVQGDIQSQNQLPEHDYPAIIEACTSDWVLLLRHDEIVSLPPGFIRAQLDTMLVGWYFKMGKRFTYQGKVVWSGEDHDRQLRLFKKSALRPHTGKTWEGLATNGFQDTIQVGGIIRQVEIEDEIAELELRDSLVEAPRAQHVITRLGMMLEDVRAR